MAPPDMKPQVYRDDRPAEYFDQFHARGAQGGRLDLYLRARPRLAADAAALPGPGRSGSRTCRSRGRCSSPPTTSARWTTSSSASTCAVRSASWRNRSSSARRCSPTSTSTEASSRSAAATTTRRPSRPPSRSSSRGKCCSSTSRAAARARASWASRNRGSAGSRSNRGRRWCRWRSTARPAVRRWKRFRFPKVRVQFGEPMTFPVEKDASRERQLEVATEIFDGRDVRRRDVLRPRRFS